MSMCVEAEQESFDKVHLDAFVHESTLLVANTITTNYSASSLIQRRQEGSSLSLIVCCAFG